jgi:hypothetical protein
VFWGRHMGFCCLKSIFLHSSMWFKSICVHNVSGTTLVSNSLGSKFQISIAVRWNLLNIIFQTIWKIFSVKWD